MNVYAFITPIILGLLLFEIIYCYVAKKNYYSFQDTIANIATAIGNQCVNLVVAVFVFKLYGWIYDNIRIFTIENTWYWNLLLLLFIDFLFYWFHRFGHEINILWAAHMPHHSSEEMNLAVGLRASVTQRIFSFFFFWPLAIVGFSPEMIYTMTAIHLLNGYWHHTRVIPKLGWYEKWFNTPSHHRVHHGVQTKYLDKNYGELLIIWDKMFGTFQEEEEEVVYGVTTSVSSWNPVDIYFQTWKALIKDAKDAPYFIDKIKIWFMPLGWRPRGLEPYKGIGIGIDIKPEEQNKFKTRAFKRSKPYLFIHLLLGLGFMYLTINMKNELSIIDRVLFSGLIFVMIVSWSGILESKKWVVPIETFRLLGMAAGVAIVLYNKYGYDFTSSLTLITVLVSAISIIYVGLNFRKNTPNKEYVTA